MIKQAVLYTNIKKTGKTRNKLLNKYVFSSIDTNISFVEEIQTFIDHEFEKGSIENEVISGDGARWIKTFSNDISVLESKFKVFILNGFHLGQALMRISNDDLLLNLLRGYISKNKKSDFKLIANSCISKRPDKAETIKNNIQYLLNQWSSIQKQKHPLNLGCCMEGRISHNIAKFFARDPKSYAFCNVEKHILFKDAFLNKVNIVKLILNQFGLLNDSENTTEIFSNSYSSNIPAMYNSVSGTTKMLKNIVYPTWNTGY